MIKLRVILFLLGVGNIFADLAPIESLNEVTPPENKDSTILEIVSYNSEGVTGNETNEILKATAVEEKVNENGNVVIKEINAEGSSNQIENFKPIVEEHSNFDTNMDILQDDKFDITKNFDWSGYSNIDDDYLPMKESDFRYKDLMNNDPNEIMATAAGFVPIPILKRRQKPRKQFINRRFFRRPHPYPYRRFFIYPYFRYHYPGSLRFY